MDSGGGDGTPAGMGSLLGESLLLRCGASVKNRMVKAATTEGMAHPAENLPCDDHFRYYNAVAEGGIGATITGNVMVDGRWMEAPGNIVADVAWHENAGRGRSVVKERFMMYAKAIKGDGSVLAIAQLSHPGRQTPVAVSRSPVAPSPVPWKVPGLPTAAGKLLAPIPRELTSAEVSDVQQRFVDAALFCEESGFDGVEIHAAHGYLISQFLSGRVNHRTDKWGGSPEKRRFLLLSIVREIKKLAGAGFIVCVKLNSADFQKGGFTEEESLATIVDLDAAGVDFVEVSGGTYELATMLGETSLKASTADREAFFGVFAAMVRKASAMPVMLTGGLRSKNAMQEVLAKDVCNLIGMARPLCHEPDLPNRLLSGKSDCAKLYNVSLGFMDSLMGPALANLFHQHQMHRIAQGKKPQLDMSLWPLTGIPFLRTYVFDARNTRLYMWLHRRGLVRHAKFAVMLLVLLLFMRLLQRAS